MTLLEDRPPRPAPHADQIGDLLQQAFALMQQAALIEADRVTGDDSSRAVEWYVRIERAAAAGRMDHARRAAQCMTWRQEGHRSAAAWLAQKTKTSVGEAISSLETASALAAHPVTFEALKTGRVSIPQAREITAAAKVDPHAETDLLDAADFLSFKGLQNRAKAVTVAAASQPEGRAQIRRRRFLRQWLDGEGGFHLHVLLTPDAGAEVMSAVRSRAAYVYDERSKAGELPESREALDADALVALVTGDERRATFNGVVGGRTRDLGVIFMVDLAAYRLGKVGPGELVELAGVGPVPIEVIEHVIGDAWVKLVIRDGVDIRSVTNFGRTIPTALRTALDARDRTCVVPGCEVEIGLEYDHWHTAFAKGGATALWNLCRICSFHHKQKTYDGYVLSGGPGAWKWEPPTPARDRADDAVGPPAAVLDAPAGPDLAAAPDEGGGAPPDTARGSPVEEWP
ncbi:MAG TPA: DUF222 domain-containing protein [Acidimicrobiales bacterium]|nr:DUF222 domain-containing protein [Acidimicrobiales bacterium]